MKIKTDNKPRETLLWHQLTEKEKTEFDYLDTQRRQDEAEFVRYKNWVYDLHEFSAIVARSNWRGGFSSPVDDGSPLTAWHGIHSDSYFSGILVRYLEDGERVVMGRYCT